MKICVVSDSHGDMDILEKIRFDNPDCDVYIHLGDSCLPEYMMDSFISVKGNCDCFIDYPLYRTIETPYGKIWCEHGHIHGRGNIEFLKEHDCKVYLYGHTHIHKIEEVNGYYFVNPGSTSRPRDGSDGTYLIIEAYKDEIKFKFKSSL